jgi:hypothetical protein
MKSHINFRSSTTNRALVTFGEKRVPLSSASTSGASWEMTVMPPYSGPFLSHPLDLWGDKSTLHHYPSIAVRWYLLIVINGDTSATPPFRITSSYPTSTPIPLVTGKLE